MQATISKEISATDLVEYCKKAVQSLLEQSHFDSGKSFRPSQREALEAYHTFLSRTDLSPEDLLTGFFEMPTGVGKTAVFTALIDRIRRLAQDDGQKLKAAIVVPTIQLLDQTRKSFRKYAPKSVNHVGLYGGKKKNLRKPITIMSYPAWLKLSEDGYIIRVATPLETS